MAACEGLLVPGAEDFGLTMTEVQAAGRPPIAFAAGGALEIVDDGRTGFLAPEQTVDSFAEAMLRARATLLDPAVLAASARRFDLPVFAAAIRAVVAEMAGPAEMAWSAEIAGSAEIAWPAGPDGRSA
jgi:glycosyltransferase involved in cell wall biosynthesis